jgi:hypothetical protein
VNSSPARGLLEILQQLPDPRGRKGRRHSLSAMLAALVCGILCGQKSLKAFVEWLHLQPHATWHWLGFFRKPPQRRAFSDLLEELASQAIETALAQWIAGLGVPLSEEGVQVWDGKTLRGSKTLSAKALQQLVRLDLATGQVLSRTDIAASTNEAKAALDLLKSLVLQGQVIVADAAYCQRDICQKIIDSGGDYVVTVKDNQPTLKRDIENAFVIPKGFSPLRPQAG